MVMSKERSTVHTIAIRGGLMAPIYHVFIYQNEDSAGYWAKCNFENGAAFTDGGTIQETQANMYESVSLFLQDDYPEIRDFSLEFYFAHE